MARDTLRVLIKLERINCFDEGDGIGSAEPYLWTVFFTIDGQTTFVSESLKLEGEADVIFTPGSHDNLGVSSVDPGIVSVPAAIGERSLTLVPIPLPSSIHDIAGVDLPGIAGIICVLMEEDNVSDSGAEAGHQALNLAIKSVLDEVIATRTPTNTTPSDAEIEDLIEDVSEKVSDAIAEQQGIFENIWSFLNADDQIGAKAFFFTGDQLLDEGPIHFSQRFENHGDWEIVGVASATVICPANALAAKVGKIDPRLLDGLRDFRDKNFAGSQLGRWWELAERHAPALTLAFENDRELAYAAAGLATELPELLEKPETRLSAKHLGYVDTLLSGLERSGSRRARIDAGRAKGMLPLLDGLTVQHAIELFSKVTPGRYPVAVEPVSHLFPKGAKLPFESTTAHSNAGSRDYDSGRRQSKKK